MLPRSNAVWNPVWSMSALGLVIAALASACSTPELATFATPEQAMQAVADFAPNLDPRRAEELFGKDGDELVQSGDDIADRTDAMQVAQLVADELAFEDVDATTKIALLGRDAWPFPIPLVLEDGRWRFDADAGRDEIDCRRVGRNELSTIATLHAFVDAQREYASKARDGSPPAFAAKVISSDGKRDGLYWPAADGEEESPLGPLVAAAADEGYERGTGTLVPYHGYFYRSLPGQGAHAPGGARGFADESGRMTRGFALISWPAEYGRSGVMTFQVNQRGIVFQKDLGDDTEEVVRRIAAFDPDPSWDPTGD